MVMHEVFLTWIFARGDTTDGVRDEWQSFVAPGDCEFDPQCERPEAAASGNRWSARVEGGVRPLRQAKNMLDRQIKRRLGKCQR